MKLDHAKQFEPPTLQQPLRFRYTTYLGEKHPAARKVVLNFSPQALPDLTEIQTNKLIKILGVRYNPTTKQAKMSCEMFPTVPQNKRFLGELLDKLLVEARDPTDTFEDIPFDFRHVRHRTVHTFPEHWNLTPERKAYLEENRQKPDAIDEEMRQNALLAEQGTYEDSFTEITLDPLFARPTRPNQRR